MSRNETMNIRSSNSPLSGPHVAFMLSVYLLSAFSLFTGLLYNFNQVAASQSSLPGSTVAISVNPSTNKTYIANPASGVISVIAGSTNTVAKTILLPVSLPVSITISVNPSTNKIYVATHSTSQPPDWSRLFVIDGRTDTITKIFPIQ